MRLTKELVDPWADSLVQGALQSLPLRLSDEPCERETPAFLVVSEEAGEVRRDGWKVFLELGRRHESVAEPRRSHRHAFLVSRRHTPNRRDDDVAYEFVARQQRLVHDSRLACPQRAANPLG